MFVGSEDRNIPAEDFLLTTPTPTKIDSLLILLKLYTSTPGNKWFSTN